MFRDTRDLGLKGSPEIEKPIEEKRHTLDCPHCNEGVFFTRKKSQTKIQFPCPACNKIIFVIIGDDCIE